MMTWSSGALEQPNHNLLKVVTTLLNAHQTTTKFLQPEYHLLQGCDNLVETTTKFIQPEHNLLQGCDNLVEC